MAATMIAFLAFATGLCGALTLARRTEASEAPVKARRRGR